MNPAISAQIRRRTISNKFSAVSVLALVACATECEGAVTITEFTVGAGYRQIEEITTGPDGNLWFTEYAGDKIGKITTSGVITEYPVSNPLGITAGPDGNLWYNDIVGGKIGKITTSGGVTEYVTPNGAQYITAGPDGNLWFTDPLGNKIGKITTSGVITEYPNSGVSTFPIHITAGPDGNLWFMSIYGEEAIGKVTTGGTVTQYPIPTAAAGLEGAIAAGPDGNLWFTEFNANQIGKITTAGVITEYPIPTVSSVPIGITAGPDGNLWFTESSGNQIGSITTGGVVTEYPIPTAGSGPGGITLGPDGNLWFTEGGGTNKIGKVTFPPNTSNGPNIPVPVTNTFLSVDVTFANVTSPGVTTVAPIVSPIDVPPPSFATDMGICSKTKSLGCHSDDNCPTGQTCTRYHGLTFDVSTTASVTPPITVCIHYSDKEKKLGGNGYVDGTGKPGLPEKSLRLLHEEGGVFTDVTLPGYPDVVKNVVCGQVSSLSPFVLAIKADMPGGGDPTTDCWSEWSLCPAGQSGGGNQKTKFKKLKKTQTVVPDPDLTCKTTDPKCKTTLLGGAACNFCVRVCANLSDSRLSGLCSQTDVQEYLLSKPSLGPPGSQDDNDSLNALAILNALTRMSATDGRVFTGSVFGTNVHLDTAVPSSTSACTPPIQIAVPPGPHTVTLTMSPASGATRDKDTLNLLCKPN